MCRNPEESPILIDKMRFLSQVKIDIDYKSLPVLICTSPAGQGEKKASPTPSYATSQEA